MIRRFGKTGTVLAAAALALVFCLGVDSAMAYFTTYATAGGEAGVRLGFATTVPQETVSDWTKHVTIANTGDQDCFVRVKAFAGADYQELLTYADAEGKWQPGADGYYYYSDVVPAGGSTQELLIGIRAIKDSMEAAAQPEDFNVIVVQECMLAIYDASGQPTADWSRIVSSVTGSGATEEGGGR